MLNFLQGDVLKPFIILDVLLCCYELTLNDGWLGWMSETHVSAINFTSFK